MTRVAMLPGEQYARDVIAGKEVACKWVRLACERQLRDLARWGTEPGAGTPYWFDAEAAQHRLDFNRLLCHSKGKWAGQSFAPQPWQEFQQAALFGWRRADGTRRYRRSFTTVARKNGKSFEASGTLNYMLLADAEPGAECYAAATKRDQARIVWGEAKRMVRASPALSRRIQVWTAALTVPESNSTCQPLGADADTMDGLNPHCAIVDELHAHKTRAMLDVLETAMGARTQPLLFMITTAGSDKFSVCRQEQDYAEKILSGVIQDEVYFALIYTLDEGDDWADERVWAKGNPNLGVSLDIDAMREEAERAAHVPAKLNAFLRLRLNVWTEQEDRWLPVETWADNAAPVHAEDLQGESCYAGLDLSSTTDLTALVLLFPPLAEPKYDISDTLPGAWSVLPFFFVPEENILERARRDRVPYDAWAREGFLHPTPGNVVDYGFIRAHLAKLRECYDIREIAYDRWGAAKLATELTDDGFQMVQFGQGFASMSAPTKELEKLVLGRKIAHGQHPVLAWCLSNVAVSRDAAENIKPDKARARERIDGITALIMALGRAIVQPAIKTGSVYDERPALMF